ncbi:MAG: hypothetical protein ACK5N0_01330 [Synechococcaceae cyanobacterium]
MAGPDPDQYGPWLRLRLRHGALADGAAVGRHLALRPTVGTASLLQRFQLRLVPQSDGVLLLAKPRWQPQLSAWLSATGGGPLRLRLLALSPQIWGATALALDARASQWQLLGRWGQQPGDRGPAATNLELSLRPLAGAAPQLVIPAAAKRLTLLDERGEVLLDRPLTAAERAAGELRQPLDGLPEGLLQPRFDQGPALEALLRLDPEPLALGVACLWLSPPELGAPTLELEWSLPARASLWHYLLVPSGPQQRLEGLVICGDGCAFAGGEQPETLPDGRTAWRLVADRPLPLAERSPYRFRLTGQRIDATGHSHPLRLDPLPAAPLGPVWPLSAAPAAPGAEPAAAGAAAATRANPEPTNPSPSLPGSPPLAASAAADPLVGLSEIVVPL